VCLIFRQLGLSLPTDEPGVVPQEAERGYFGDVAAEDVDRLWRKVFRVDEPTLVLYTAHDGRNSIEYRDVCRSAGRVRHLA